MSTETVKKCDTTGTYQGVKRYRVSVEEVVYVDCAVEAKPIKTVEKDLSPAGLKRALKFIQNGLTPTPANREEVPERTPPEAVDPPKEDES